MHSGPFHTGMLMRFFRVLVSFCLAVLVVAVPSVLAQAPADPASKASSLTPISFAGAAQASLVTLQQAPTKEKPPADPKAASTQDEAQTLDRSNRKIPPYVLDIRLLALKVPKAEGFSSPYSVAAAALPAMAPGGEVGLHVYPLRTRTWAIGLGAAGEVARGHASASKNSSGAVTGADVTVHLLAITPQLSLNFGTLAGWSYLSLGVGASNFYLDTPTTPSSTLVPRRKTVNYGGGGRWFFRDRMAFTLDLRFYAFNPVAEDANIKPSPRVTTMVIGAGLSFR